jgi:hypothetical protein
MGGKVPKCREMSYEKFSRLNISEMKLVISEIVFKARKEI